MVIWMQAGAPGGPPSWRPHAPRKKVRESGSAALLKIEVRTDNDLHFKVSDPAGPTLLDAYHVPALLAESLDLLAIRPDGVYVDATLGGGGHSRAILDRLSGSGRLIGLDQDTDALEQAGRWSAPYGERFLALQANFENLDEALDGAGVGPLDGALFDLGVSSHQLDVPGRGFSFRTAGPLDMRMDPEGDVTAEDIIRNWPERDLADALRTWGEERYAGRNARAIVRRRDEIRSTADLADVVKAAVPGGGAHERIHPATRTFQALRIVVNREMEVLAAGLEAAMGRMAPGGRIVVIAYHSLEDRIVKNLFRERATGCICPPRLPECRCGHAATYKVITRKPVTPSDDEVAANPRARSARVRAAERLKDGPVGDGAEEVPA